MTNHSNRRSALLRKRKLAINLMINSLRIIFRFLKLLFNRKKLECISFQADVAFCIKGTINQLSWNVQNSIFITISNSSQIFFDSSQLLFQVKKEQTAFELTAYGIQRKTKLLTAIKIIALNKKDVSNIVPKSKKTSINKIDVVLNKKIQNSTISFQNRKHPIPFKQIHLKLNKSIFPLNTLTKISSVSSIEELKALKNAIEKDLN